MGKNILKFINYTKEAFFWPLHLVTLGILGLATVALAVAGNQFLDLNPTGLFFTAGGLELVSLSLITRSRRFRRAINSKYGRELTAYAYIQQLAENYNELSAHSQRRFEALRQRATEAKKHYKEMNKAFPDLVKEFIVKIDTLQINFVKLLRTHEHFPKTQQANHPELLRRQIREIHAGMGDDSPQLRKIKEKRVGLLQQRIRSYNDAQDNYKMLVEQLKTIEEMVKFFAEQPLAGNRTEDLATIEGLLNETNDLHDTLSEVNEIMRSDLQSPTTLQGDAMGSSSANMVME